MSRYFATLERRTSPTPEPGRAVPLPDSGRTAAPSPEMPAPAPAAHGTIHVSGEYGVLRERLLAMANGKMLRTIVFAACTGDEGGARIVTEFAQSLAGAGLSVLLIDLHGRTVRTPGVASVDELTALVAANRSPIDTTWGDGRLALVPAHVPVGEKERLFTQPAFTTWIAAQRAAFDYVLIDAPPLLRFADATLVGRRSDGVVLVVEAEVTERRALVRARRQLAHAEVPVIGVVLNNVRRHVPALFERFLQDD
jgi:Mrp family chromosome partitioning ATPase